MSEGDERGLSMIVTHQIQVGRCDEGCYHAVCYACSVEPQPCGHQHAAQTPGVDDLDTAIMMGANHLMTHLSIMTPEVAALLEPDGFGG